MNFKQIDGKSYGSYKRLRDVVFTFESFQMRFTRVQSDPYAPPSVVEIVCDHDFSKEVLKNTTPAEDLLYRVLYSSLKRRSRKVGSGNSGYIGVKKPSNCVLKRSAVELRRRKLFLRLFVGLPADGRRIDGREAEKIVMKKIPAAVNEVLSTSEDTLLDQIELYNDQNYLRRFLKERGAIAFIAEGSILPRRDSFSEEPMVNAKPFRVENAEKIELPSGRVVRGLLIPEGLTVITGGAYHGKTTLLEAIQRGIYNHIRGDGREFVISRDCVTVFAENGRVVNCVDISSFIDDLPSKEDTKCFSTKNASGSTSMASSIVEAIEMGCDAILIDEDTSATNLLYKDDTMERLIKRDAIRPLCYQVRSLIEKTGVSVLIVSGASSAYLPIADRIILMEEYEPRTLRFEKSQKVRTEFKVPRERWFYGLEKLRRVRSRGFRVLLEFSDGKFELDLSTNKRVVEEGQVNLIARGLEKFRRGKMKARDVVKRFNEKGFEFFQTPLTPDLTAIDGKDFLWALNRVPANFG